MKMNFITTLSFVLFPILLFAQDHFISGKVHRYNFDPLPNFEFIAIHNNDTSYLTTNTSGEFILESIPHGSEVTFSYHKPYDIFEHITILDRIIGREWLLQVLRNSTDIQALAGDMDFSGRGKLSAALIEIDLVIIAQLILKHEPIFPVDSLWRLVPTNFTLGTDTIPNTFTIEVTQDINNFDFFAVKKGDLAIEEDYMPAPPEAVSPTFTISQEDFELGDTVTYEISVQDFHNIAGFPAHFKMGYEYLRVD